MDRVTKLEVVGSKNNRRIVVRERYLRDDIPCRSLLCSKCDTTLPSLLSADGDYIIPDVDFILYFLEILESPAVTNIILLESVLSQVKSRSTGKFMGRIKKILHNPIKCCITFPNETCVETFTPRETLLQGSGHQTIRTPEPLDDWILRSLRKSSAWYQQHLRSSSSPPRIKLVRADEKQLKSSNSDEFCEISLDSFVDELSKEDEQLPLLLESLKQVRESPDLGNENNTDGEYSEHLSSEVLEAGIKSGILLKGKLQVNKYSPSESFVRISDSLRSPFDEVFISNLVDRNRGIHGDVVAVEILPESKWVAPKRGVVKEEKPNTVIDASGDTEDEISMVSTTGAKPTGIVVGIIQRNWRVYAATIQPSERNENMRYLLAVPMDIRIPKVRIASRQSADLVEKRLAIRLDDWPRTSQYPSGHYISILGPIGDIDTETKVLMIENEIALERRFSQSCMAHLPATVNDWKVTESDIQQRRDLRSRLIMSIDPPGCEDIDDALSIYEIPKKVKGRKVLEIGVHIADVTHFVPHESLLDREARERGTSVYLADRRMDMLPFILSGQLCSLREQQNRFAMSVLWTVDAETFEIISTWYGKTLIFSSHEFSYQTAQTIINNDLPANERKKLDEKTGRRNEYNSVRKGLLQLLSIARKYRKVRETKGMLELHSTEVKFELTEQKTPSNIKTKQTLEVMKMVEEYMILANQSVAEKIYRSWPTSALLRRHPFPRESDFRPLQEAAAAIGFIIDTTSNKALAESLNRCVVKDDEVINNILRLLATQAMSEALYISSGDFEEDEFYHYGLAAEFYTHFTSPIRRYVDVIVHRQLCDSIAKEGNTTCRPILTQSQVAEICQHINVQNRNAKMASMDSARLFHGLYFKSKQDSNEGRGVHANGVVYSIKSNGFVVFVPEYGVKGVVHLTDINGNSMIPRDAVVSKNARFKNAELSGTFQYDRTSDIILLDSSIGPIEVSRFSHCTIEIGVRESAIRWPVITLRLIKLNMEAPRAKVAPIKLDELSARTREAAIHSRNEKLLDNTISCEHLESRSSSVYRMFEQFRKISI